MNGMMTMIFLIMMLIFIFYFFMSQDNNTNDPTLIRLKNKLIPYFPELIDMSLARSKSSYTWNKSKIYICTSHKGVFYDDNMLTYVILHELAHVYDLNIGHTESFQEIFDSFLKRAEKHGLFDPDKPRIQNYCKN